MPKIGDYIFLDSKCQNHPFTSNVKHGRFYQIIDIKNEGGYIKVNDAIMRFSFGLYNFSIIKKEDLNNFFNNKGAA